LAKSVARCAQDRFVCFGLRHAKTYNGYWFLGRPSMEDLRQDLRAVSKKCRPD